MKILLNLRDTSRTAVQGFKTAVSAAHILYYLDLKSRTTTQQHLQPPAVTSASHSTPMLNVNVRRRLHDDAYCHCCLPLLKRRRAGVTGARRHALTTVLHDHLIQLQSGATLIMIACLHLWRLRWRVNGGLIGEGMSTRGDQRGLRSMAGKVVRVYAVSRLTAMKAASCIDVVLVHLHHTVAHADVKSAPINLMALVHLMSS